jgi:hypothetical protein
MAVKVGGKDILQNAELFEDWLYPRVQRLPWRKLRYCMVRLQQKDGEPFPPGLERRRASCRPSAENQ